MWMTTSVLLKAV